MLLLSTVFYIEVILNEIGITGYEINTYCKANESCDEIIHQNKEYVKRSCFKITEKEKTLPIMYWIPKMQKNPTRARFIIVSKMWCTKPIFKSVSNVFNLV